METETEMAERLSYETECGLMLLAEELARKFPQIPEGFIWAEFVCLAAKKRKEAKEK